MSSERSCRPGSTSKIHLQIIRSDDCFACRKCCRFAPADAAYAPLFTDEQRRRALAEFPGEDLRFERHGDLWRVALRKQPDSTLLVCPLLDREGGACRVYSYGVFDCDTWPYEITERDGRMLLTVSLTCPVVGERFEAIRARGLELQARMLARIRRHPENLIPYHDKMLILADLGPAPAESSREYPVAAGGWIA